MAEPEVIRIPTEIAVLRERLNGLGRLLTARKWERAAIVYAFTEPGEIGRGRWYKPDPPRMHIREFAAQGFVGLTTNKAVSRYRDAWVKAIDNGWAAPVKAGQLVRLPDKPFPPWPYAPEFGPGNVTVTEVDDLTAQRMQARDYHRRPSHERILGRLEGAVWALSELDRTEVTDEARSVLVGKLTELRRQTDAMLKKLRRLSAV